MDYALVFKWLKPVAGREAKALEVLADVRMFFGKLQAEGKVEEPLVLTHWNNAMVIVRGELETMFHITNEDEFIMLMDRAMFVAEGFEFHTYSCGELADHRIGLYARAGSELAYM